MHNSVHTRHKRLRLGCVNSPRGAARGSQDAGSRNLPSVTHLYIYRFRVQNTQTADGCGGVTGCVNVRASAALAFSKGPTESVATGISPRSHPLIQFHL